MVLCTYIIIQDEESLFMHIKILGKRIDIVKNIEVDDDIDFKILFLHKNQTKLTQNCSFPLILFVLFLELRITD